MAADPTIVKESVKVVTDVAFPTAIEVPLAADTKALFEKSRQELDLQAKSPLWKEWLSIATSQNPEPDPAIEWIIVLSGRGSYLKNAVDAPDIADKEDDYQRMRLGIEAARRIVARRLGKPVDSLTHQELVQYGPMIVYNGRPLHNQELVNALGDSILTDYPFEKFILFDLTPGQYHTKEQFLCIKNKLNISNTAVMVITNAFHFPRVSRMIGEAALVNPFGPNTRCQVILNDRQFRSPGIEKDIRGEFERVPKYIATGDLAVEPCLTLSYRHQNEKAKKEHELMDAVEPYQPHVSPNVEDVVKYKLSISVDRFIPYYLNYIKKKMELPDQFAGTVVEYLGDNEMIERQQKKNVTKLF